MKLCELTVLTGAMRWWRVKDDSEKKINKVKKKTTEVSIGYIPRNLKDYYKVVCIGWLREKYFSSIAPLNM